mmetsp:Transcript_35702/g.114218  ORF Transcript_35702/g.114218 Transcript_35702/m.114218 type:complete len:326 (-) Transcript_35702:1183-2160(-)
MPNDEVYGAWPRSGELDVMESRGNDPIYANEGVEMGNARASATFHFGPDAARNGYFFARNSSKVPLVETDDEPTLADGFHVYGLYWSDAELYAYVDDQIIADLGAFYGKRSFVDAGAERGAWDLEEDGSSSWLPPSASLQAPFDQEFYLIVNLAVGGTSIGRGPQTTGYFPDDVNGKPWKTSDPFPQTSFYRRSAEWLPSWTHGEPDVSDHAALRVDSVKVWGFKGKTTFSTWAGPSSSSSSSEQRTTHTVVSAARRVSSSGPGTSSLVFLVVVFLVVVVVVVLAAAGGALRHSSKKQGGYAAIPTTTSHSSAAAGTRNNNPMLP